MRRTPHREGKASVKVIYYTHKTLADGSHPFLVRITKDRKVKYISTGLSLAPAYWNEKKNEVRRNYPEPDRSKLIKALAGWQKRYQAAADTLADGQQTHGAASVAEAARAVAAPQTTLLRYGEQVRDEMRQAGRTGNADTYRVALNQLRAFLAFRQSVADPKAVTDLPFGEITVRFCNEWETWMRHKGVGENTMHSRFRTLRAIFNRAIAEDRASMEHYPFARTVAERHKFKVGKFDTNTKKRAISRADIAKIEGFVPRGTHEGPWSGQRNGWEVYFLQLAKDVFLFSYYVAGINFVDIGSLRWRNLVRGSDGQYRIEYERQKTGGKFSVLILPPAMAILDRYRSDTHSQPDDYIFPVLDRHKHTTPKARANALKKGLKKVNACLKQIAERAGIEADLTTYVARHSFGTNLRHEGVSDAKISQLYGHATERQTTVYLDGFGNAATDEALSALLPKTKNPAPDSEEPGL